MNAKDIGTETNNSVSPHTENSWENGIIHKTESLDLGIFFDFGIQYKFSPKLIFLFEGNLNSGLMLLESDKILVEEIRNKSFSLNLGLDTFYNCKLIIDH